jgi:hypothetical protein
MINADYPENLSTLTAPIFGWETASGHGFHPCRSDVEMNNPTLLKVCATAPWRIKSRFRLMDSMTIAKRA